MINRKAVLKDAIMQVGASLIRLRRAKKHIDKLNDGNKIKTLNALIHHQEFLYDDLCRALKEEQKSG